MQYISLILFICSSVVINAEESPTLEISDGKLKGGFMKTEEGRQIIAFQGIPYAEPPLRDLRFESPIPIKPWNGVLEANKPPAVCPQRDIFTRKKYVEGNEDCLYLNVYKPKVPSPNEEQLPVMVFIHGGGFLCWSGNSEVFGPQQLLDRDVILVTFNYRLGALGFLSTGDEVSPGNYGLKDQSLVLKWVKKNIKYFGGDPNRVTIFGESAGAASTHYHMLSPLSRGLFKGVISQSGNALCNWALARDGENIRNAKKLAESVGCPTNCSKNLVECLRNVDPMVIAAQDTKFMEWDLDPLIPFKPVVEHPSPEAFLLDTPANLLKAGKFEDVPWLFGVNRDEGAFRAAAYDLTPQLFNDLSEDFNNKVNITLLLRQKNLDVVGNKIRKFYFGDQKELNRKNSMSMLIKMYSDGMFTNCLAEAVALHLKVSKEPLYNYLFDYEGSISASKAFGSTDNLGICHTDELMYMFPYGNMIAPNRKETHNDKKVRKLLTSLWANFARTGNPTPEIDDVVKTKWDPTKSEKLEYFQIDVEVQEMKAALFENRVEFWKNLTFASCG